MTPRWVGDYLVCDEIGAGGMARVYLGQTRGDFGFKRTVALKTIVHSAAADPRFVSMFIDEARLASRIHHPNVVGIVDVVAANDSVILVLDYIHGETLANLMDRSARAGSAIPVGVAVAAVRDLLRGLHAAHEAAAEDGSPLGIVHRDVSPQNVIVGADGSARLFDFGVAKAAGRLQTTKDGSLKGKLGYMAVEQLRDEPVDRRADIYAAAVILWELLAGRRLFTGESEGAVLAKVLCGDVELPSRVRDDVPPALDDVVMRGLHRHREKRFATAAEMATALDEAVEPADAEAVARLVKALAADGLEKRAALVARAEQCVAPPRAPEVVSAPAATQQEAVAGVDRPRPRAIAIAASLIGAGVVLALVLVAFRDGRTPASPQPVAASSTPAAALPPPAAPSATAIPAVESSETSPNVVASARPSGGARSPAPAKKPSPVTTRATVTTRPCATVVVDDAGIRRYNRDCL